MPPSTGNGWCGGQRYSSASGRGMWPGFAGVIIVEARKELMAAVPRRHRQGQGRSSRLPVACSG